MNICLLGRIVCGSAAAIIVWASLAAAQEKRPFTADRHKTLNVACAGCHTEEDPKTPASAESCVKCHKSIEEVAGRTKDWKPNPHSNHLTEGSDVECTQCHQGHKTDLLICNRCHGQMSFEKQPPEGK